MIPETFMVQMVRTLSPRFLGFAMRGFSNENPASDAIQFLRALRAKPGLILRASTFKLNGIDTPNRGWPPNRGTI